ncbi:MAG: hypothetical protein AAF653_14540 [Chloroflexota bacterium]
MQKWIALDNNQASEWFGIPEDFLRRGNKSAYANGISAETVRGLWDSMRSLIIFSVDSPEKDLCEWRFHTLDPELFDTMQDKYNPISTDFGRYLRLDRSSCIGLSDLFKKHSLDIETKTDSSDLILTDISDTDDIVDSVSKDQLQQYISISPKSMRGGVNKDMIIISTKANKVNSYLYLDVFVLPQQSKLHSEEMENFKVNKVVFDKSTMLLFAQHIRELSKKMS